MSNRFPRGIDITAPGGITALMAFHRKTFGDAVMEVEPGSMPPEAAQAAKDAAKTAADAIAADAARADEKLGEPGLKALQAERDARAAAEKRATDAEAKIQAAEDAKLSDIQRANKERDDKAAESAKLLTTVARLTALADWPVPKEYQDLVTGTDEASFLASAKKISELYARAEGKAPKPAPVPGSGGRSEGGSAGSSLSSGRDLYESRKPKKS